MAIVRTKNHGEIRRWVSQHGGRPVFVRGAGAKLDVELPDSGPHPGLKAVDWDRWFAVFDAENLQFVYDDVDGFFVIEETAAAAT